VGAADTRVGGWPGGIGLMLGQRARQRRRSIR
jgi:hypothetical protein